MRPLSGSASFNQPVQSAKSEHSSSELVLNVSMLFVLLRKNALLWHFQPNLGMICFMLVGRCKLLNELLK